MALGSTQPLTEMSTRNISCGLQKSGAEGLTTLKSGSLYLQEPSGPVLAFTGFVYFCAL